jgi:hypothetical protein
MLGGRGFFEAVEARSACFVPVGRGRQGNLDIPDVWDYLDRTTGTVSAAPATKKKVSYYDYKTRSSTARMAGVCVRAERRYGPYHA